MITDSIQNTVHAVGPATAKTRQLYVQYKAAVEHGVDKK